MKQRHVVSILFLIVLSLPGRGEKLSLSSHDSLISKLESVIAIDKNQMLKKDSMLKQAQIVLRLADLYAERARLLAIDQEGQGEIIHKDKIKADRLKALTLYKNIQNELSSQQQGRVLLQAAHLNILLNDEKKAIAYYNRLLTNRSGYPSETIAIAYIQLGDIYFQQGKFSAAKDLFTKALTINSNPRKSYAHYRKIWCEYNLGNTKVAQTQLLALLRSKELLNTKQGQEDLSFKEDLSRDLATFMAKNDISLTDITILEEVSPSSVKQKNLIYLASELDRTAKKNSAIMVWHKLGENKLSFEDKLEGQIKITRIQYDLGDKKNLLLEIKKSIALLQQTPCPKNPECLLGQQNLKKILTDWGKAEERNPSTEVIVAFGLFSQAFDDYEMSYWTAQTAHRRRLYNEASISYQKTATLIAKILPSIDKRLLRIFENSLLGSIEAAEKLNSQTLKLAAYRQYLELNPGGEKFYSVKYQIAHLFYEKNDFENSLPLFKELALESKAPIDLRDKSAELCLDISALTKNDAQIEKDSLLFSSLFKNKAGYFLTLWRKAILNQAAKILQNSTNQDDLKLLDNKISSIELSSWPIPDKKKILNIKLSLGIKLKNLDMTEQALQDLLAINSLSKNERNSLLNTKVWVHEMRMEFDKALAVLKTMSPEQELTAENYYLKRILFSELTKNNPLPEYLAYLKVAKNTHQKQEIIYKLILLSPTPIKEFKKYKNTLKSNNPLYTSAALFAYERTKNLAFAKSLLIDKNFKNSFEGSILDHALAFKELAPLHNKIKSTKIVGVSERKLQKNLALKIKLLSQLEKHTQNSVLKKDTSLQLITLAYLSYENTRIAKEILNLPAPRQLTAEQRSIYQSQVQEKTLAFNTKAIAIKEKALQLWNESMEKELFRDLFELSQEHGKPGSELAKIEILNLKTASQIVGYSKDPFIKFTEERHKMVKEAQTLEQNIARDPFNINDLEKYKSIHKALGNGPYVAYLDYRLTSLNKLGGK